MNGKREPEGDREPEFPFEDEHMEEVFWPTPEDYRTRQSHTRSKRAEKEVPDGIGGDHAFEPSGGAEEAADAGGAEEPGEEVEELSEVERQFREARKAAHEQRFEAAIQGYREVVALDPQHVRARNNLGVLLDRSGRHGAALEQFRAALAEEPSNTEVLSNAGAALAALNRFDEAEARLREALRLDPSGVDVRANLGILFVRKGLYAKAESELRWVCERNEDHGAAHFYRGEVLNRLGRVDEAMAVLERAARLQPDNPRIYYLMGILYDKKHLPDRAGPLYRKARELSES